LRSTGDDSASPASDSFQSTRSLQHEQRIALLRVRSLIQDGGVMLLENRVPRRQHRLPPAVDPVQQRPQLPLFQLGKPFLHEDDNVETAISRESTGRSSGRTRAGDRGDRAVFEIGIPGFDAHPVDN